MAVSKEITTHSQPAKTNEAKLGLKDTDSNCKTHEKQYEFGDQMEQQRKDSENENIDQLKLSNMKFFMVLVGFGMAFVGSQTQPLIFAAIMPLVAAELDAADQLVWFMCAQIVAIGVTAPFAGPLSDLFGRKYVTLTCLILSMAGMILSAATPNAAGFLAGQAFSGIGIAVQELMAVTVITEMVPTSQRGFYVAMLVSAFVPFAPASLYGALIARASWRYCACMIAVWNFVTATAIYLSYFPAPRINSMGLTWLQKLKRIDFPGGLLLCAGLVILLVGINSGGQPYPWNSARIIALLTVGIALLVLTVLYELFVAPHPMFPRRLLQYPRPFVALMVVIFMAGINYIPLLFFWVLECVSIYDSTTTEVGIRTLPFGFCIFAGALFSAALISMFRSYIRLIMTSFCIIQAAAIACMSIVDVHDISTTWAPLTLGLTFVGGVLIPNQLIVTIISPDDLIGTATSLTVCLRAIGQVVGLSIFYNQFISEVTERTMTYVVPAALQVGIFDLDTLLSMMPTLVSKPFSEYALSLPQLNTGDNWVLLHEATIRAFSGAFSKVYLISIAFGAIAVIASLFIGDLTTLIDEHIAVAYFH